MTRNSGHMTPVGRHVDEQQIDVGTPCRLDRILERVGPAAADRNVATGARFHTKLDRCGSASIMAVLRPDWRAITARLVAVVDFPLPPLPTQATMASGEPDLRSIAPGAAAD